MGYFIPLISEVMKLVASDYQPLGFDDTKESKRIFDLLEAYKIPSLELVITPHPPAISNGSVEVLVFSVERK
jgi:hypothetical protein